MNLRFNAVSTCLKVLGEPIKIGVRYGLVCLCLLLGCWMLTACGGGSSDSVAIAPSTTPTSPGSSTVEIPNVASGVVFEGSGFIASKLTNSVTIRVTR